MGQQILILKESQGLAENLKFDEQGVSLSLYNDELATDDEIGNALELLSAAFPMQDTAVAGKFFVLLANRIKANKMTGKRLSDAVANLLDNHHYASFKIADIISFDRREKLYTYSEVLREVNNTGRWDFVFCCEKNGRKFWKKK